jgi:hypothetical protein
MLKPFPVVRVRGFLTPNGVRITLFTVRAPQGARIVARCRGHGCPARRLTARSQGLTHLRRFERAVPVGVRFLVLVTARRRIGKYAAITVRRGRAPARVDRCVNPGSRTPTSCPG